MILSKKHDFTRILCCVSWHVHHFKICVISSISFSSRLILNYIVAKKHFCNMHSSFVARISKFHEMISKFMWVIKIFKSFFQYVLYVIFPSFHGHLQNFKIDKNHLTIPFYLQQHHHHHHFTNHNSFDYVKLKFEID